MGSTAIAGSPVLYAGRRTVQVPAGGGCCGGTLAWPCHPSGVVLLAPAGEIVSRGQAARVATQLRDAGIGTLLLDLPYAASESERVGDIEVLAECMRTATAWLAEQPEAAGLPLGYFGSNAGGAAALAAAATWSVPIEAVVVCARRPDLLGERLSAVRAPTLLIVGSKDQEALRLNRAALVQLGGAKRLVTITGAGPEFREAATLEEVGRWAAEWFVHYLAMERTWRAGRQPRC